MGDLVPNVLARNGTERRLFRRLPNTHVSRNPREGGVPTPHRNREVECADDAHHAEGVILFVHPVVGTLRVHGEAIQLAALAHSEIADVDHLLHLTKPFLVALAHFIGHKGAKALFFGTEGVAVLANHFAALRGGPFAPFHKGVGSSGHHALVIVGGGCAQRGDAAAIYRRMAVNAFP